ncbi:MAG: 4Fe-4S binding protein [Planctomycetes bacterium]|nr:4Fe-4S binding protein [Planctomycetota bacterium]
MKKLRGKQSGEKDKPAAEAGQPVIIDVPKGNLVLIKDRCKSCGFCIEFCPKKVLEFSSEANAKGYRIPRAKDPDACILCGFCSMYCPDFAIYQTKNDKTGKK